MLLLLLQREGGERERERERERETTVEIQREQALQRPQFQPMQFTCDVMAEEPGIAEEH